MITVTLSDTEADMIRTALWQHVHPANINSEKYSNLARRFRTSTIPAVLAPEAIAVLPYDNVRPDLVAHYTPHHDIDTGLVDGRYQPAPENSWDPPWWAA